MNFINDELNGHQVRIRPGFLKQNITIDGKKVPKQFLKYNFPFQLITTGTITQGHITNSTERRIVADKDIISLQKGKIFVNNHEFEL